MQCGVTPALLRAASGRPSLHSTHHCLCNNNLLCCHIAHMNRLSLPCEAHPSRVCPNVHVSVGSLRAGSPDRRVHLGVSDRRLVLQREQFPPLPGGGEWDHPFRGALREACLALFCVISVPFPALPDSLGHEGRLNGKGTSPLLKAMQRGAVEPTARNFESTRKIT